MNHKEERLTSEELNYTEINKVKISIKRDPRGFGLKSEIRNGKEIL